MSAPSLQQDQLTTHEYDGIREYDNATPGWWHAVFFATVVFSIVYVVFWHASIAGWTVEDAWHDDQKAEFIRVFGSVGELKHDQDSILTQMNNPQFMTIAKATFQGNCAACHAKDGGAGGLAGVNLCDEAYKNINNVEDLYRIITDGANSGAMPSWKVRLSENERVILAAYVASLRGTIPAGGKPAEGKTIPPWPPAPPKPAPVSK